jgi:hypothetical protein
MTQKNGHKPEHQHQGNGHEGEEHGHATPAGVIPESSPQDLLLKLVVVLALIGLVAVGFTWSMSGKDLTIEEHSSHESHEQPAE